MKLQSLKVEQLRQFRQPFALEHLQPGLNLIHGPNESGKSTLVRAIRAAFFERYRSQAVDDLRPWGDSAAAPTVELAFEHQGAQWRLVKSFLKRTRCDLSVGNETWSEDDAEEKLAELLGYQYPKRGASKAEHWGIPGLLWVEQGTGQDIEQAVEHAGDHLKSALNALVGEVASTGGDAVIEEVKGKREVLLTATGQPKGDYKKLDKEREDLQQQVDDLQLRVEQYQGQVDRLGQLSQAFDRTEQEKPWDDARRQLDQAREQLQQVEQLEQQQEQEKNTLAQLVQNRELLEQNLGHLSRLDEQRRARKAELESAERKLQQTGQQTAALAGALNDARAAYENARSQLQLARQQEIRQRLEQDLRQSEQRQQALSQNLARAREYQQQVDEAREEAKANRIDTAAVARLKTTARELNDETIRSGTVATRLSWQLQPGASITLDDRQLEGQGEQQLLEASQLVIPGVGTLGIAPGGEELASTRRKLETLEQSLDEQLQAMAVASVEQADSRASAWEAAEQKRKHAVELLRSVAPAGLEPLETELAELQAELKAVREKLEATPVSDQEVQVLDLASAESALASAEKRLNDAEASDRSHQAQLLTGKQARDNAKAEWLRLEDEANSPERQQQLTRLTAELARIEQQQVSLRESMAKREQQIREARPDILRQDIDRFQRTIQTLQQTQEDRQRELRDIRVRLEAWGAEGLEEQLSEKRAELEQCQRRYQELGRRARALDLLLTLLTDKRQALTRRLQAPLQKHLNHYLSLLFPNATLEVDEHLRPGTFNRGNELGQIAELSFGAREQMGLISRLAYADLLREAQRPTLILLDDTLVHSDQNRLEDMKRILFDAASRHQILLFTCHPEKWQDLGVPPIDLQKLKS